MAVKENISPVRLNTKQKVDVAYFSMEVGLRADIPVYCGGLGILGGDILKSAADVGTSMVGVSLMYHYGYLSQKFDETGWQYEEPEKWNPAKTMQLLPQVVSVKIEDREVKVRAWKYEIKGATGHVVPVYYLDTNFSENQEWDREICYNLYKGSGYHRLVQEVIIGMGGVKMLKALGYEVDTYHINEGHVAFLTLELLKDNNWKDEIVKNKCVFTTHTPIKAGHESFSYQLVFQILGEQLPWHIKKLGGEQNLNMTLLALNLSRWANGVAKKHQEISKNLFPAYDFDAVTNGIHPGTWVSPQMAKLFDKYVPQWMTAPEQLLTAGENLPEKQIWTAHQSAKKDLIKLIKKKTGCDFSEDVLTIGFARRIVQYKRAGLIFSDIERLVNICGGKVQFVFAGKAHYGNDEAKEVIQRIIKLGELMADRIKVVFLENYNMDLSKVMIPGVDIWLNNPQRPHEASGTSGMKASINGVPNFSVLDGWWIEGWQEKITGWSIGDEPTESNLNVNNDQDDVNDFYNKLENVVIPAYYEHREEWLRIMKASIVHNGAYFNTHRVVREYTEKAYSKKNMLITKNGG